MMFFPLLQYTEEKRTKRHLDAYEDSRKEYVRQENTNTEGDKASTDNFNKTREPTSMRHVILMRCHSGL
jgi:hypothetical protein